MRVALVGEAPGRHGVGPPSGRVWKRLGDLAGVHDVREIGAPMNLLGFWPGRGTSKGAAFPRVAMMEAARYFVRDRLEDFDRVVLLGARVAWSFSMTDLGPVYEALDQIGPLEWRVASYVSGGPKISVVPHPSGVNRWWNEPKNVEAARKFLRALVEERKTK